MRGCRSSSSEARGVVSIRPPNGTSSALTDGWMAPLGTSAAGPCHRYVVAPWHVFLALELLRVHHCPRLPLISLLGVKALLCWGSIVERGPARGLPGGAAPTSRSCDISSSAGLVLFGSGGPRSLSCGFSHPWRPHHLQLCLLLGHRRLQPPLLLHFLVVPRPFLSGVDLGGVFAGWLCCFPPSELPPPARGTFVLALSPDLALVLPPGFFFFTLGDSPSRGGLGRLDPGGFMSPGEGSFCETGLTRATFCATRG